MSHAKIVSPEQFKALFRQVVREGERQAQLTSEWSNPLEFTELMLNEKDGICQEIAGLLNLKYDREYWSLDAVLYEEAHTDFFGSGSCFAKHLNVVLEHENLGGSAHEEINKLSIINSPLKVLITYIGPKHTGSRLSEFAKVIQAADVFSDFSSTRKQLVIVGHKDRQETPSWSFYVFKDGQFVEL